MTRKDYVAIAEAIRSAYEDEDLGPRRSSANKVVDVQVAAIVRNIARTLQADNPRFDANRFIAACGLEPVLTGAGK